MFQNQKDNKRIITYVYHHLDHIIIFISIILIILTRYLYPNYLLFHSIAEIFSIIIAGGIFFIGWNSRKYSDSSFFFILGISFLFIGAIDTLHTLGYTGMGIFTEFGSNLPTSLWIAARYMQSISLLVGLFFINKKINQNLVAMSYLIITTLLLALIFTGLFPACYDDFLQKLTPFKIISEYVIIGILLGSLILMYKLKNFFDRSVFRRGILSIIFTMASEVAFTLYTDVFGIQNLIGHVFKIIAFYFAYKAIIEIGMEKPFSLMFRKITQSEKKFRLTFENAPDAIFWADIKNGKILNCNHKAELLLERTKEEIVGMHQRELHPPEQAQYHEQLFERHVGVAEDMDDEAEVITKSGKIIPVLINASMIEIGGIPIIQGIFHDVTNIRLAEKKIKESEEKYRSLIEDSLEGVWVIDGDGKTTLVNPSMARMLGYRTEEMMGKSMHEFMDDEYSAITIEKMEDRKKGIGEEHEFELLHKNGRIVNVMIRSTPIFDKQRNYQGAMAFITDETERKKAERKLELFVSTVSHELRTPITVLMMSIDYLKKSSQDITPDIEKRLFEGISRNITLLNDLIEDILLISQIDEKKVKLESKQYYPSKIIQENLNLMENNIKTKNLILETKVDNNIILYGDLKRIDQVFRIFIDNAIKYSKDNLKIEIKAQDNYKGKFNLHNNEGVLFQFIDQGLGIREKDIPQLFDRFFRTEDVIDIPGTGLGLSIAKSLVDLHEGEIFVESEYGKGSTFSIFLPRKISPQT